MKDPYGAAVVAGLLIGINVGVLILFFYQTWIAIVMGPSQSKLKIQKKIATRLILQILENQRGNVVAAVKYLDMPPSQASAVESVLLSVVGGIPKKKSQMDKIDGVVEMIQKGTALKEPWKLVEAVIQIAKKVSMHLLVLSALYTNQRPH